MVDPTDVIKLTGLPPVPKKLEPVLPEVDCHVGNAPAPFDVRSCPDVPTPETFCNAPVDVVPPVITE